MVFKSSFFSANVPMVVTCGPTAYVDNLENIEAYTREQSTDAIPSEGTEVDLGVYGETSPSTEVRLGGNRDTSPLTEVDFEGCGDYSPLNHPLFARLRIYVLGMTGLFDSPLLVTIICTVSYVNIWNEQRFLNWPSRLMTCSILQWHFKPIRAEVVTILNFLKAYQSHNVFSWNLYRDTLCFQ